jgi:alkanesulfonate monooxygenase SsuD/methylene tetrahydromethanopterin reductase-like flavin-dependent oxidoreductase (luciferase family)
VAPWLDSPVYAPQARVLPVWIAVGGNPASVVRAGRLGQLRIGVTSHFYVEKTSQGVRDTLYQ